MVLTASRSLWLQLRGELAHVSAEAKFQKDRHDALVAVVTGVRAELAEERGRVAELQSVLLSSQRVIAERDAALEALRAEAHRLQEGVANTKAENHILKTAEARLSRELSAVAEERDRQARLVDSLRGLEETLKAHESDMRKRLQVRPPHTRATHAYRCCHHAGLDVGLGLDLGLRCNRVRMLG